MAKHRNKRTPKLRFSTLRGVGWHVTFRDPLTGIPKKHRFGIREEDREPEARVAYHRWIAEFLENGPSRTQTQCKPNDAKPNEQKATLISKQIVIPGSMIQVASGFLAALEARVKEPKELRRQGTIPPLPYIGDVLERFGQSAQ